MDRTEPFFSIIIVVYNGAKTIASAIESVLAQIFTNFELVIIDGGSRDNTTSIIKSYGNKIHFFSSEPDHGIYDAMNKGIAAAKGEFLYFLGSDDTLFNENVLQQVADSINRHPADLIYGNVLMSVSGHRYDGAFSFAKLLTKNISHQAIFYKRTIFQQLGGYNLEYKLHADWDFNLKCFTSPTIQTQFIDVLVARFTEGNTSSKPDRDFIKSGLIPDIIRYNSKNPDFLRSIANFDFLWRQIRNASIKNVTDIKLADLKAPYLDQMIRFQDRIQPALLTSGFISKSMMTLCYLYCKLKKAI